MPYPFDRASEDPGGMECEECNVIFVGSDFHRLCAVCAGINAPPPPGHEDRDTLYCADPTCKIVGRHQLHD